VIIILLFLTIAQIRKIFNSKSNDLYCVLLFVFVCIGCKTQKKVNPATYSKKKPLLSDPNKFCVVDS